VLNHEYFKGVEELKDVTLNEEEVKIKEICRDFIKRWNVYKFDG
jgi:hypothetical protein